MTENKAGICNTKQENGLVSFSCRISPDWLIKGFKWNVATQRLWIPAWRIQHGRKVQWPKTVEVSSSMRRVIEAECKERWPVKAVAARNGYLRAPFKVTPTVKQRKPFEVYAYQGSRGYVPVWAFDCDEVHLKMVPRKLRDVVA